MTDQRTAGRRAFSPWWAAAGAVVLASLLVQAPAIGYPLVWDDQDSLVARGLGCETPLACFTRATNRNYYRPVFASSMAFGWALSGRDPQRAGRVMHLENLAAFALELLVALAFFSLVFGALDARAVFALGVLGLHPLQASAVAWISGRADLLPALFALASFAAAARAAAAPRPLGWLAAAVAAFALAVGAKEQVIPLALLFPLLAPERRRWLPLLGGAGGAVLLWWLASRAVVAPGSVARAGWTAGEHATVVVRTVAHVAKLFAWPGTVSLPRLTAAPWDHLFADELILAIAALLGWLGLGAWLRGRRERVFWLWATLAVGSVLNLVPLNTALGPYRLVLPLVGVAGLAGAGLGAWGGRRRVGYLAGAGLLAGLAFFAASARSVFESEADLAAAILEADPDDFSWNLVAARELADRGQLPRALEYADHAVDVLFGGARGLPALEAALPSVERRVAEHTMLRPPAPWTAEASQALCYRSTLETKLGRLPAAAEDLDLCTRLTWEPAWRQRYVETLRQLGRVEEAEQAADELSKRSPRPERPPENPSRAE